MRPMSLLAARLDLQYVQSHQRHASFACRLTSHDTRCIAGEVRDAISATFVAISSSRLTAYYLSFGRFAKSE